MAGHSKWKNIRLHKGKADQERGKLFAKLSREITIAAKTGGGNPDSNPRLRLAIDKARQSSMPVDNIKRATQKGTGELASENFEEIAYEGYGPGGVAVLVEAATDNRNRTVAEVRSIFNKNGGSLGESGSVAWQFNRRGQVSVPASATSEDDLLLIALEAGAEDIEGDGDFFVLSSPVEALTAVKSAVEAAGLPVENAEVALVPTTTVPLEGDAARKMLKLLDALEDQDDVQNVAANFEIADDEFDQDG